MDLRINTLGKETDIQVLNVIEARSSDSGIYVCAATNEAGTAQQAYTLEVLGRFQDLLVHTSLGNHRVV